MWNTLLESLAVMLKNRLPNATHLSLANNVNDSVPAGTIKTSIDYISSGKSLMTISEGNLVPMKLFEKIRDINFISKVKSAASVPWGDVVNTYHR